MKRKKNANKGHMSDIKEKKKRGTITKENIFIVLFNLIAYIHCANEDFKSDYCITQVSKRKTL